MPLFFDQGCRGQKCENTEIAVGPQPCGIFRIKLCKYIDIDKIYPKELSNPFFIDRGKADAKICVRKWLLLLSRRRSSTKLGILKF